MATSEATARKGGPERAGALHLGPVLLFDLGPVDLGPTDVLHLDPVVLLDPRPPRTAMASAAGVAYADATMADAYDALAARLSDRYAREVSWLRNGQLFVGIAGGGRRSGPPSGCRPLVPTPCGVDVWVPTCGADAWWRRVVPM